MNYPPDDVKRHNAISKVISVIITTLSIALILSVPIEQVFVFFGMLPFHNTFIVYCVARMIVGLLFLAIGIVLYKIVDWDYGSPQMA